MTVRIKVLFFPRVRTPCGHGAQVIVEGREEQSDGGEKNKDPKTNPNQTPSPRPKLHHLVVFPLHWVKHVKRKLMAINGPEFSKEKGRQRRSVVREGLLEGFKRTFLPENW